MGVSENSGTPKSSILIGFSIINHPFWGTSIFGNTHIVTGLNRMIRMIASDMCLSFNLFLLSIRAQVRAVLNAGVLRSTSMAAVETDKIQPGNLYNHCLAVSWRSSKHHQTSHSLV